MDLFQPFQEPVLKLWADDTLWSKFVAHDFWKAHHSNPDQKSANDVTLVLLKKNIQFLIMNAASLQESLGVNFLDPVFQEDLLHRVAWGRRHLHRKLAGTEQEQKWKTLVATRIHSDWPKVAGKVVTIGAWENFLVQFWAAGNSDGAKVQAQKRASKPEPTELRTPTKTEVTGESKNSSPASSPGTAAALEMQLSIQNKRYDDLLASHRQEVKELRDEYKTQTGQTHAA